MARSEAVPVGATPEPRMPNPFLKSDVRADNEKAERDRLAAAAKPSTKADVIRLWGGGEHKKARDLYFDLKLGSADQNEVIAACPGWEELATQS